MTRLRWELPDRGRSAATGYDPGPESITIALMDIADAVWALACGVNPGLDRDPAAQNSRPARPGPQDRSR